jgi:hypothetical protein
VRYSRLAHLLAVVVAAGLLLPTTVSASASAVKRPAAAAGTEQVVLDEYGKPLPTPKLPPGIQGLGWSPTPVWFINLHSSKCLEIQSWFVWNAAPAQQWTCLSGGTNQKWWRYHIEGDGSVSWYYLYNAHSGKCLEVDGPYPHNGARITQWECYWGNAQKWKIYGGVENGGYWLYENEHTHKCLEIGGWRRDDGAPAIQWDCHGGANQRWGTRWF